MNILKYKGPVFDPGLCRCCGGLRKCRVLNVEYDSSGQREIYCDMIMDCFGLMLTHLDGKPNERLICAMCVQRLREAFNFRQQVLRCEEIFIQMKMDTANEAEAKTVEIIIEPMDSDHTPCRESLENYTSDYQCNIKTEADYNTKDDDLPLQNMVTNVTFKNQDHTKIKLDEDTKNKGKKRPQAAMMPKYARILPKPPQIVNGPTMSQPPIITSMTSQNPVTSPNATKNPWPKPKSYVFIKNNRQCFVTEKMAHIVNAATILQNSNATPFKGKTHSGLPCFYCRSLCENLEKLKEHQSSQHQKSDLRKVIARHKTEALVLYADVTDLKCTICDESIPKLNDLKSHLIKSHSKKLFLDYNDRVIPFKLTPTNVYECQICGSNFESFGSIERHMNVHFRNYVCKECGTGFITKHRLTVHISGMHKVGSFPCDICKKMFTTQPKLKNHVDTVHKMVKRFKCPKCQERFTEYFRRQKHLVEVHGVAPLQYKCNVCDKTFEKRYILSKHMKRDHLGERNFQCELCVYNCFAECELRRHMIKHNGERVHECSVCKKSYARKKTLREHMRIHNNDRRYACDVCGQAFVQNCSLKGHMKTHHLE